MFQKIKTEAKPKELKHYVEKKLTLVTSLLLTIPSCHRVFMHPLVLILIFVVWYELTVFAIYALDMRFVPIPTINF